MAKEGLGFGEGFSAEVIKGAKNVSVRLLLIEDDQGQGQNVKPLAQVEIAKIENFTGDPKEMIVKLAAPAQEAIEKVIGE